MKKILVPTDFSSVAANALTFAQRIAEQQAAEVTVMHAYHPSMVTGEVYIDAPLLAMDKAKREQLQAFVRQEDGGAAVATSPATELRIGFAAEEIIAASKEADLIVMGTTGEGSQLEKLFGSVSTLVAGRAGCPVLMVPAHCTATSLNNIVYASDFQEIDKAIVQEVIHLLAPVSPTVHLVHVDTDTTVSYDTWRAELLTRLKDHQAVAKMIEVSIGSERVEEGVIRYAEENEADIIVVATTRRGMLERLFHKSVTKEMVFHTTVPLLVMRYSR